jgi:hypothetical protein
MTLEGYLAPPGSVEKVWFDDTHQFEVYFDRGGRVVGLHQRAGFRRLQPTLMDRLRHLFGPLLPELPPPE